MPGKSPKPVRSKSRLTRRVLLGTAAAAGAAPLIAKVTADADVPKKAPVVPPAAGPSPIDPAFEISPPEPPLAPWKRPRLSQKNARRLMKQQELSAAGETDAGSQRMAATSVPFTFAVYQFEIREVPHEVLPYYRATALPLVDSGRHDAKGVRMWLNAKDNKVYNHPVAQAQYGLGLLESYRITGDKTYLDRAKAQAQRLVDTKVVRSNAWFYPYRFAFQLHGNKEIYNPPWYSMMGQGQALSLFSRLFQVTEEAAWKTAADNTFKSYLLQPVAGQPWGVYVVNNHLLFEEYPLPNKIGGDRTYNGHTFAIYGLYDYWVLTKDADAKLLIQGGITTTRDWNASYRSSGWRSKYCLTHGTDSGHYHDVHMGQFAELYAITGDKFFAQAADTYYGDFPPGAVTGTVRLGAGGHTGVKFDSAGKVTARKTLRLNAISSAPSSSRAKVWTQPGVWYTISAGGLSGYSLQESVPTRYQVGTYAGLSYLAPRAAKIKVATPTAYLVDSKGKVTEEKTTYAVGAEVTIDSRAVLNGVQHVRLDEGDYAAKWLTATSVTFS